MSLNAGLFPHRPPVDEPERERLVVRLGTAEAADLCRSLASETATRILARLYDEPTTASDVADHVDTSLQNAHYHLERLSEAGLVEVVDIWYSSRGVEMNVYAPAYDEFVVAPPAAEDAAVEQVERHEDAERTEEADEREDARVPPVVAGPPS